MTRKIHHTLIIQIHNPSTSQRHLIPHFPPFGMVWQAVNVHLHRGGVGGAVFGGEANVFIVQDRGVGFVASAVDENLIVNVGVEIGGMAPIAQTDAIRASVGRVGVR